MEQNKYLRPMGLGEILDSAVKLYRKSFLLLVTAQLPTTIFILFYNIYAAAKMGTRPFAFFDIIMGTAPSTPPETTLGATLLFFLLSLIQTLVVYPFTVAAVTKIASDSALGKSPSVRDAFSFSFKYWGKLMVTNFLVFLAIGLVSGFFVSVPLAIMIYSLMSGTIIEGIVLLLVAFVFLCVGAGVIAFLWTRWIIIFPAAVNETVFITSAMKRSWNLVKGTTIKTFIAVFIIYLIPTIVQMSPAAIEFSLGQSLAMLTIIFSVVSQGILVPLADTTRTVVYFELRARKEGFDLEQRMEKLIS